LEFSLLGVNNSGYENHDGGDYAGGIHCESRTEQQVIPSSSG